LNHALPCIRVTTALVAIAIIVSGCAGANNTASSQGTSQGTNQGEQPYKTAYGLSSEGTTTDLYTELFGARKTETAPATVAAAPPPAPPVTTETPLQPAQPATAVTRQTQTKPATAAANRQVQQAPAPVQVAQQPTAQQPAAPQPPPEPDTPTMYGISSNGTTTDLFTELFGPRRRDGQ
jgi:cytoskeletal protein RodZ